MAGHAVRVVAALRENLPASQTIAAIDGVDEQTCAAILGRSAIFLSFSEFEGLPLPPLEAALSGNRVIGYTGQGAKDYWSPPIFDAIQQGDIIGFVETVRATVAGLEAGHLGAGELRGARRLLARRFSLAAEQASLANMLDHIEASVSQAKAA